MMPVVPLAGEQSLMWPTAQSQHMRVSEGGSTARPLPSMATC